MMVVSLAACGSTQTEESKEASKESVPTSESQTAGESSTAEAEESKAGVYPVSEETISIKAVYVNRGTADDNKEGRIVWDRLSEFTNVDIEWEVIDSENLPTYMAAGDWPDFFFDSSGFTKTVVNDYGVAGGKFLDYSQYLDVMPNMQQLFVDYPLSKVSVTESNGEMYGFPYAEDAATTVSARPYVRTDILEEYGLSIPKTTEEFRETLRTLKEKTGEAHWIPSLSETSHFNLMLYAAFGEEVSLGFDDDGTGTVIWNRTSEQMRRYLTFMNELYEEGLIHSEFLTMEGSIKTPASKLTAFPDGSAPNGLNAEDFEDGEIHLAGVAPLTSEYDSTQTLLGANKVGNKVIYVSAATEYPEEICRMLDVAYATEEVGDSGLQGESFCYGFEGEHWTKNADGKTYSLVVPEGYDGTFTNFQYGELIWHNFGRADALAGLTTDTVGNAKARQTAFAEAVIPYMEEEVFPANFLTFTEDEQYVIDNKFTDIKTYYTEMQGKFITGAVDIDTEWDTYVSTLESMGIKDVIDAYQAAYDRLLEVLK